MSQQTLPIAHKPLSPWDVGHHHGLSGRRHAPRTIPSTARRDYSRGYARGVLQRVRQSKEN